MIASLNGTLKAKSPTEVLVDVHGVGYAVSIPVSTFEKLGALDTSVFLFTYLHVREETLHLFGFATEEERALFRLLLSVNGIGPKIAQGILSGIPAAELKHFIATGNVGALTSIPGVGKKTAERIMIELRDKIGGPSGTPGLPTDHQGEIRAEALQALTALGYQRASAEKAIRQALSENKRPLSLEELIKLSLRYTTGG
ncbi:MAG: Holliday junction branch migration protein RuvA [Ignavibacteriales bacterium]|nr:Holliday junction branch migration protein RuvA [Ignavibacteriales bacterium]